MLDRKGFNPTVYDKNISNKEKKVDVAIGEAGGLPHSLLARADEVIE
jgi:hypothetical protein